MNPPPLTFVTGNIGKFRELQAVLGNLQLMEADLPEVQQVDARDIIRAKVEAARTLYAGPLIVEDTALHFACLGGLPGPFIKWFLASLGNAGLHRLVQRMGDDRAEAVTTIGYAAASGDIHFFTGRLRGRIVAPRGSVAFGWNPIFQPEGHDRTFAEMTLEEKNAISMRRLAAEGLRAFLFPIA